MAAKKGSMTPNFTYEGVDRKGLKVKGEIPSKNMALAKVTLRKQGISVAKIYQKRKNQSQKRKSPHYKMERNGSPRPRFHL